jgi:hypothetical protein
MESGSWSCADRASARSPPPSASSSARSLGSRTPTVIACIMCIWLEVREVIIRELYANIKA